MEQNNLERIEKLESKHKNLKYAFITTLLIFIIYVAFTFKNEKASSEDIIKVKGLVIVDDKGNPRIVMGTPINELEGRKRNDTLIGISYLDEKGVDRLTFGHLPAPLTTDGLKNRRVEGVGILIHDSEGIERGGYSVLDDETALLTIDWPKTGEAIAISSGKDFSGIGLFHKSELGIYREAITIGNISSKEQSFIKIVDTNYVERLRLELNGTEDLTIHKSDKNGKPLDK